MPTTLSATDICCVALAKIGAQPINSITDQTSASAIACNTNFLLCYLEVSRASRWNCLVDTQVLVEVPQDPLPGSSTPSPAPDWEPNTTYAANTYLSFGGYIYIVAYDYTSTNNFTNDLTTGALIQTNSPTTAAPFVPGDGSQYASGWAYKFILPTDYQLLVALNDNVYWSGGYGGSTSDYQIMGDYLFCNWSQAVIQYVKNQPDCTRWDAMFTNAMTLKLASSIATALRQDGGRMEAVMLQAYNRASSEGRTKNGGEQQARRFNLIGASRFLAARLGGRNG